MAIKGDAHPPHDHARHDHPEGEHASGHGGGDGHDHGVSVTEDSQRRVFWVMLFTGVYMVAQATGGWLSGSLALIAERRTTRKRPRIQFRTLNSASFSCP